MRGELASEEPLRSVVIRIGGLLYDHEATGSPLCGNTIGFDRAFLKAQAPYLLTLLHYRNIDVSTLKNVMKMHFPGCAPFEPADKPKHRALDDLHNSIAEYQHYLGYIREGL